MLKIITFCALIITGALGISISLVSVAIKVNADQSAKLYILIGFFFGIIFAIGVLLSIIEKCKKDK